MSQLGARRKSSLESRSLSRRILFFCVAFSAGCERQGDETSHGGSSVHASEPAQARGRDYPLTDKAQAVKRLLDAGSFDAAEQVVHRSLEETADDAGLYCQYVRFLILSRDPASPGFIQTPLYRDADHYWATGVAQQASNIATQLDPGCKAYLASLILSAFAERLEKTLEAGRGCIGPGEFLYNPETGGERFAPGTETSMINICWSALSMLGAQGYTERYEALTERFVRAGKVVSAMMLGNLTGDLHQGGSGDEDFKRANRAFLDVLSHYEPDGIRDWLTDAADSYPQCFHDEMARTESGVVVDSAFAELKSALEARGVEIPPVSEPSVR